MTLTLADILKERSVKKDDEPITLISILENRFAINDNDLARARAAGDDYLCDVINKAQTRILDMICNEIKKGQKNDSD